MPPDSPRTLPHRPERKKAISAIVARARELRQAGSKPEAFLWSMLRNGQIAGLKFRRQHPIPHWIADFYCAQARLVIELDGESHIGQADRDARRDDDLRVRGYKVVRVTIDDLYADPEAVIQAIAREAGVNW